MGRPHEPKYYYIGNLLLFIYYISPTSCKDKNKFLF